MKLYDFHGSIPPNEVGKELRTIVRSCKSDFKVLTGYGSRSGICKSKEIVLKSLYKMLNEGLIKGFLPAELFTEIVYSTDKFYDVKMNYRRRIEGDRDAKHGNEGVIFVFVQ